MLKGYFSKLLFILLAQIVPDDDKIGTNCVKYTKILQLNENGSYKHNTTTT